MPSQAPEVDLTRVRPYGDHLEDGVMQLSFTLPVPHGPAARKTALELARTLGLDRAEVVHHQRLLDGYTHFVLYAHCPHTFDYTAQQVDELDLEYMAEDEIEAYAEEHIGRPIVVVGACTGSDTHSVGIDAMLDLKGFHGNRGLEGYRAFDAHNLGSQVANSELVARAIELDADAILVSQTVTQQDLHIQNLTELVEIVEAEGRRRRTILASAARACRTSSPRSSASTRASRAAPIPPPRDVPRARARGTPGTGLGR